MKKVHVVIDGTDVFVPEDFTVLEAAREAKISIPTLCFLKDISELGCCRMCLVEIEGNRSLQASCVYKVKDGMVVHTHSPRVNRARKTNLELILSNHRANCQTCTRSHMDCELQILANKLKIGKVRFRHEDEETLPIDVGTAIVRDPNRCILCRRCVSVCKNIQNVGVIDAINRGFSTVIGGPFNMDLEKTPCVNCGQCINYCPTGALKEKDGIGKVWDAIYNPDLHVVVQTAPAVRAALGEEFLMPIGTAVTGKMVTALKMLGFDKVFDTDTGADLTIMEEGSELIERIRSGGKLPLITSCSPGWVKYCEHRFPDLLDNLSSCKSPHQMFGAIIKSYYAKQEGIDPDKIFTVSVMPCTAKKYEAARPEMEVDGRRDVDAVITTRELAKMINSVGIVFDELHDSEFDNPFGKATGAGHIFGVTGGVMEAALRTVADMMTGESSDSIEYEEIRGEDGIREMIVHAGNTEIRAAAAHGLGNASALMERVRAGEHFDFIEVMACPGGCVTGGGQPLMGSDESNWMDLRVERAKALYREDRKTFIRKSHNNPAIKKLYRDFLGNPGGAKAHELLHTEYRSRGYYED